MIPPALTNVEMLIQMKANKGEKALFRILNTYKYIYSI